MFASTFVFVYVQVTVSPSPSELTVATPVPRSVVIVEVPNAEVQVSEDSLNWLGIGVSVKVRLPPLFPGTRPPNVWLAVPLTVVRLKLDTPFPVAVKAKGPSPPIVFLTITIVPGAKIVAADSDRSWLPPSVHAVPEGRVPPQKPISLMW